MEGRLVLDTLSACKERRFSTYTLQSVCNALMGKSKLDVIPADMFKAFQIAILGEPDNEDLLDLACTIEEGGDCR